jgi:hypothetical protein
MSIEYINNIYFAHPINTYGTEVERICIEFISKYFRNSNIINPSDKRYQSEFSLYKELNPDSYMNYFKGLVNKCDTLVYLPFMDGQVGAGVWYEAKQMAKYDGDIYQISYPTGILLRVDIDYITDRLISIEETRDRIRYNYIG